MEPTSVDVLADGQRARRPRDVWIIVCQDFHGPVGPIPNERLVIELAADASQIGERPAKVRR